MTSETHPTAVQSRLRELLLEFARDYQDCHDRLGKPEIALDGFETFLTSNPESPFAQAIRERDEAIALLRYVRDYSNDPGVVARARAFLSNFSEEDK